MNIETKKGAVKFDEVIAGYGSEVLAETDVIVDTTAPDILQILRVDTTSGINEKEVTNDKIILRGDVYITILYIPDPKMCSLPVKSINTKMGFTDVCHAPGVSGDMKVQCFSDISHTDYTLINSRKINIKSTIKTQFKASKICESSFVSDIEGDINIETKKKEMSVFRQINSEEFEFAVSDKIEFPSNEPTAQEILKISANISGSDAKLVAEKCVIKGICNVNILYISSANDDIEFMEQEIPFTEVLDIPGACEEMEADVDYAVSQLYYETDDSGNGISSIGVEVKVLASVNVSGEETADILSDCYSHEAELCSAMKACNIDRLYSISKPQILIKGDVCVDESKPPVAKVCNVTAKPFIDSVLKNNDTIDLNGHLSVCVLYISENCDMPLCTIEDSIPFNYSLNTECESDFAADCSIHTENVSYTLSNDKTITIRANTDACVRIICRENINVIDEITLSEYKEKTTASIVIYFVQKGDCLWDVAKKYRTGINKIATLNNISENTPLSEGMKLLIPTS